MTVKSERVFWVECDEPGCDYTTQDYSPRQDTAAKAIDRVLIYNAWTRKDGKFTCSNQHVCDPGFGSET